MDLHTIKCRTRKIIYGKSREAAGRIAQGFLLCLFVLAALCTGCTSQNGDELQEDNGQAQAVCTETLFAMDTYMVFTAYGAGCEAAVAAAMQEVERLDALLSTEQLGSEVSLINQTGTGTVSKEVGGLLEIGMSAYNSTGGLFDFTIYPLVQLWGFTTGEYHVPSGLELDKAMQAVGAGKLSYRDGVLTLQPGQKIDFGGIAKGYAASRVLEIFKQYGISSAMVSLGGNIQVLGRKTDGTLWRIGIQDPEADRGVPMAVLSVEDLAVVTSGGYERYFEKDGARYVHILDPRTGCPAESGLLSATAVSADGTLADALSTSLYIMGIEDAINYWKEEGCSFDMVLFTEDRKLYVTKGLAANLESSEELHIIEP